MAWRRLQCQKHLSTNGGTALWRVVTSPSSHQRVWVWVGKYRVYIHVGVWDFCESCHKLSMPDQGHKTWYFHRIAMTQNILYYQNMWFKQTLSKSSSSWYQNNSVYLQTQVTKFGMLRGGDTLQVDYEVILYPTYSAFLNMKMSSCKGMLRKWG